MVNNHYRKTGRRKLLTVGAAGLGGGLLPSIAGATRGQDRGNQDQEGFSNRSDLPFDVKLVDGELVPDFTTRNSSQVLASANPPTDAQGGPEQYTPSDIEEVLAGFNEAQKRGVLEFSRVNGIVRVEAVGQATHPDDLSRPITTVAGCNRNDSNYNVKWNKQVVKVWMDDEMTDELAWYFVTGGTTAGAIGLLSQAGIVTAPPGWAAALLGLVLGYYAADLDRHNKGCGVRLKVWVYHGSPVPFYDITSQ